MLQQLSAWVAGSSGDNIIYLEFGDVISLYADLFGCSDAQAFARQDMTSKDWRCGAGLAQGQPLRGEAQTRRTTLLISRYVHHNSLGHP